MPVISATDFNETGYVDEIIFEDYSQILESGVEHSSDDEINESEKNLFFNDMLNSNESEKYSHIEFSEESDKEVSYTNYSNESVDNPEISSNFVFGVFTSLDLNILHDFEMEMHIFIASYEFEFNESNIFDLLILDVNPCFDKVFCTDLTEDIIFCSKKIKYDYLYFIDNIILDNAFYSPVLSFFNSFFKNKYFFSKSNNDFFYVKYIKWC